MRPSLRHVGKGHHPLVVIDEFLGNVTPAIDAAVSLAPFPRETDSYYPGVRRVIEQGDTAANAYVDEVMNKAAQFIAGAYDAMRFKLITASFSVVTSAPDELLPMQRAPHFDSTDPDYIALIHYLNVPDGSGTAFYRQRSTAIERVDKANVDRFVNTAVAESRQLQQQDQYIQGSNDWFEELDRVEGLTDRLVFYQGSMLHSGIIPPGMVLDPDPSKGRLTANFFFRLDRKAA